MGRLGEQHAAELLKAKGYSILDMNWACRTGELDIVARKGYLIVFAEVKTRSSLVFGTPGEAVDAQKRQHMKNTAMYYLKMHRICNMNIRFDVIEVYIDHIEGAF